MFVANCYDGEALHTLAGTSMHQRFCDLFRKFPEKHAAQARAPSSMHQRFREFFEKKFQKSLMHRRWGARLRGVLFEGAVHRARVRVLRDRPRGLEVLPRVLPQELRLDAPGLAPRSPS